MGEISWDEKVIYQIGSGATIRILEKPERFNIHWIKNGGRFHKHACIENNCDLCNKGIKKTPRYYVKAYDYSSEEVRTLEMGISIYQQILNWAKDHGLPIYYDIEIMKIRGRYSVRCEDPTPLTVRAQNIVDEMYGDGIPIGRKVLDGDDCPHCKLRGVLDYFGAKCICPSCNYIIWERLAEIW